MPKEKWIIMNKKADFDTMVKDLRIDPLSARILANRGIEDVESARRCLEGTLTDLPDPAGLKDAEAAAEIVARALQAGEKVAVASDYDVDGVFGGQILKESLEMMGFDVKVFAPRRLEEGYGLNQRIVEDALAFGAGLLITCDNGIAAAEAIDYARSRGLKVIVTDHHEVPEKEGVALLPEAEAVVDPKRPDCGYPFEGICGAVVGLKVMLLACRRLGLDEMALLEKQLPYAAIATVADLMQLREENRILVREGLARLPYTENTGLRCLLEALGLTGKTLTAYHIGFVIGPCFNAAGRLETAELAQQLLNTADPQEAGELAARLVALNRARQTMTEEGAKEALALAEGMEGARVLVIHLPHLHESIAGIVAGRLKEKLHKPALVVTGEGALCKGSARSIPAYPLLEKMKECSELFTRFGGHALAAGFSMEEDKIEKLRQNLNQNSGLTEEDLCPIIQLDAAMPPEYATPERIREWENLGPFGSGFERPLFGRKVTVSRISILGQKRNALRLRFEGDSGQRFEGIWFGDVARWEAFIRENYGEKMFTMLERSQTRLEMALAYQPMLHEFNGMTSIQFQIKHFQAVT